MCSLMVLDSYTTGSKFPRRVPREAFGRRPERNPEPTGPWAHRPDQPRQPDHSRTNTEPDHDFAGIHLNSF